MDNTKALYFVILVISIFAIWQYFNHLEGMSLIKSESVAIKSITQENSTPNTQSQCQFKPQYVNQQSTQQDNQRTCSALPNNPNYYANDDIITQNQQTLPQQINIEVVEPPVPPPNPFREYDYRTFYDPLVPPLKRDDYNEFMEFVPSVYTRGYPTGYKKMGMLIDEAASNTDPYKFMILVGRLKYPRGTVYEYYATENKPDGVLKFDLHQINRELLTDDTVNISELGKTYKVKIDRTLGFDYAPFLY